MVRAAGLEAMSEKLVRIKTPVVGINPVETHVSLAGRYQSLVAQGKVDTAPQIPFSIKAANIPNSSETAP